MKPKPNVARPSIWAAFVGACRGPTGLGIQSHRADRRGRNPRRQQLRRSDAGGDVQARERHVVRGLGVEREQERAEERVEHRGGPRRAARLTGGAAGLIGGKACR
jgi:hypothetical protein